MPENSNCSSLVGDEARGRPTVPVTVENVGQIALSTDNAGFRIRASRAAPNGCGLRRSFRTCASRTKTKKRGGALATPPEEHKRPRVGGSRYSSFISTSLLLSQEFTRAAHCLSVQNCTILKSVGGSRRVVHCSRNQAPGASPGRGRRVPL